ncbi:hypothetical protein HPHPH21_1480 [Helicobacter pylori Hp H-21]|nr:hypothetical protein HPHPH21_1480 [Helicobacter pylori Hp H-21]
MISKSVCHFCVSWHAPFKVVCPISQLWGVMKSYNKPP